MKISAIAGTKPRSRVVEVPVFRFFILFSLLFSRLEAGIIASTPVVFLNPRGLGIGNGSYEPNTCNDLQVFAQSVALDPSALSVYADLLQEKGVEFLLTTVHGHFRDQTDSATLRWAYDQSVELSRAFFPRVRHEGARFGSSSGIIGLAVQGSEIVGAHLDRSFDAGIGNLLAPFQPTFFLLHIGRMGSAQDTLQNLRGSGLEKKITELSFDLTDHHSGAFDRGDTPDLGALSALENLRHLKFVDGNSSRMMSQELVASRLKNLRSLEIQFREKGPWPEKFPELFAASSHFEQVNDLILRGYRGIGTSKGQLDRYILKPNPNGYSRFGADTPLVHAFVAQDLAQTTEHLLIYTQAGDETILTPLNNARLHRLKSLIVEGSAYIDIESVFDLPFAPRLNLLRVERLERTKPFVERLASLKKQGERLSWQKISVDHVHRPDEGTKDLLADLIGSEELLPDLLSIEAPSLPQGESKLLLRAFDSKAFARIRELRVNITDLKASEVRALAFSEHNKIRKLILQVRGSSGATSQDFYDKLEIIAESEAFREGLVFLEIACSPATYKMGEVGKRLENLLGHRVQVTFTTHVPF